MFKWLSERGYRELRTRLDMLEAEHLALQEQHKSLRSRFYATRHQGSGPHPDRPASAPLSSKDDIRRQIAAGRFRGPQFADQRTEPSEG